MRFRDEIQSPGKRWRNLTFNPTGQLESLEIQLNDGKLTPINSLSPNDANVFYLDLANNGCCSLTGGVVHRTIVRVDQSVLPIRFKNSVIGELKLQSRKGQADRCSLELENCWVGSLILESASVKNLTITGGGIASIRTPPADGDSPFVGSVEISANVSLPTSDQETSLFEGPQSYRNLYAHLIAQDNSLNANRVRALQLRSERSEDPWLFRKIANWFYGAFSNYGVNPGRPLLFLTGVYGIAVLAVYFLDQGGTLGLKEENYVGELKSFMDPCWGRLARSVWLPFQSLISPLFIVGNAQRLVVPNEWYVGLFLLLQGFFCDLMLLFTIFGLRRRFKIA